MGVGLALKKAPPWHNGIGIVPAAVTVLYCVFKKGRNIGLEGFLDFGRCKGNTPGLGKGNSAIPLKKVPEGEEPTGLGKDLALEATAFLGRRREIALGILLKGIPALLFAL